MVMVNRKLPVLLLYQVPGCTSAGVNFEVRMSKFLCQIEMSQ